MHHPIWDYDLSSAPLLMEINVAGKPVKAVALPTKESFLYVFDRATGKPVWPIEERPVPQSDVPGEKSSPTQPFPTKPPPYARAWLTVPDDLIDFTPEMRAEAIERIKHHRVEGMFTPPVVGDLNKWLGGISMGNATGGTNWAGGGFDPETHTVYVQAANSFVSSVSLRKSPDGFSDIRYVSGREDQPFRIMEGPGFGSAADAPQPGRRGGSRRGGTRTRCRHPCPHRRWTRRAGTRRWCCRRRRSAGPGTAHRQASLRRAFGNRSR